MTWIWHPNGRLLCPNRCYGSPPQCARGRGGRDASRHSRRAFCCRSGRVFCRRSSRAFYRRGGRAFYRRSRYAFGRNDRRALGCPYANRGNRSSGRSRGYYVDVR